MKGFPAIGGLQPKKENIWHFKTMHFLTLFFNLWVILASLDPDRPKSMGFYQYRIKRFSLSGFQ
jgi:hypothetical protein